MNYFDELVKIIARLRDPQQGCPWDLKQTPLSLVPNFIEELYEAVEAIEKEDYNHLCEELGDLLLHILMQARIAEEKGRFTLEDLLQRINDKLTRRHPHIFDNIEAKDASSVKINWEKIKLEEKKHVRKSIIEGIPLSMPALIVAQRMQEKAASVGFDWTQVDPALDKIEEEIKEFRQALQDDDRRSLQAEMGDMLFSLVNISRKLEFDAETALRKTIDKFARRFRIIEEYHQNNNKHIQDSSLEQLDEIWEKAKKTEF